MLRSTASRARVRSSMNDFKSIVWLPFLCFILFSKASMVALEASMVKISENLKS